MAEQMSLRRGLLNEIAPGVWYCPAMMANVYFVQADDGSWVMVDAGTPGTAWRLRLAARQLFGERRGVAILLTHGHFDHVGGLRELADEWDVPVYAHRLEAPYLDGRDIYPPMDPTCSGGLMPQLSRLFPRSGATVPDRLKLYAGEAVPHLPGWRLVETPGHTPGHVSLFRDRDRLLIAGDAVITVNQENPARLLAQAREFRRPPVYATYDWLRAKESVRRLADLRPLIVATGHGLPIAGDSVPDEFDQFANLMARPKQGRYVDEPALADENGFLFIPPAPPDMVPVYAAGVSLAAAGLLLIGAQLRRKRY
jgi:glyoxylase-like metal-dependent hydrolase (beta-lactamase superfamily II)